MPLSRVYIFLSEEEKKLGLDLEQLTAIEREIAELSAWIARQRKLADLKSDAPKVAHAKGLLGSLNRTLGLYENYRWIILKSIKRHLDRA